HDTMEFSAPSDGDDQLDIDDASYEEDGISALELEAIEDDPAQEAAALNAVETDLEADPDRLPDENWTDDLPDDVATDEDDAAYPR
ncbi:MAG TPA: hypothetical protein VK489_04610, partial [Ferruginibacter sp.]|nr:hypothetical protein [Ferruginibacter sp.]